MLSVHIRPGTPPQVGEVFRVSIDVSGGEGAITLRHLQTRGASAEWLGYANGVVTLSASAAGLMEVVFEANDSDDTTDPVTATMIVNIGNAFHIGAPYGVFTLTTRTPQTRQYGLPMNIPAIGGAADASYQYIVGGPRGYERADGSSQLFIYDNGVLRYRADTLPIAPLFSRHAATLQLTAVQIVNNIPAQTATSQIIFDFVHPPSVTVRFAPPPSDFHHFPQNGAINVGTVIAEGGWSESRSVILSGDSDFAMATVNGMITLGLNGDNNIARVASATLRGTDDHHGSGDDYLPVLVTVSDGGVGARFVGGGNFYHALTNAALNIGTLTATGGFGARNISIVEGSNDFMLNTVNGVITLGLNGNNNTPRTMVAVLRASDASALTPDGRFSVTVVVKAPQASVWFDPPGVFKRELSGGAIVIGTLRAQSDIGNLNLQLEGGATFGQNNVDRFRLAVQNGVTVLLHIDNDQFINGGGVVVRGTDNDPRTADGFLTVRVTIGGAPELSGGGEAVVNSFAQGGTLAVITARGGFSLSPIQVSAVPWYERVPNQINFVEFFDLGAAPPQVAFVIADNAPLREVAAQPSAQRRYRYTLSYNNVLETLTVLAFPIGVSMRDGQARTGANERITINVDGIDGGPYTFAKHGAGGLWTVDNNGVISPNLQGAGVLTGTVRIDDNAAQYPPFDFVFMITAADIRRDLTVTTYTRRAVGAAGIAAAIGGNISNISIFGAIAGEGPFGGEYAFRAPHGALRMNDRGELSFVSAPTPASPTLAEVQELITYTDNAATPPTDVALRIKVRYIDAPPILTERHDVNYVPYQTYITVQEPRVAATYDMHVFIGNGIINVNISGGIIGGWRITAANTGALPGTGPANGYQLRLSDNQIRSLLPEGNATRVYINRVHNVNGGNWATGQTRTLGDMINSRNHHITHGNPPQSFNIYRVSRGAVENIMVDVTVAQNGIRQTIAETGEVIIPTLTLQVGSRMVTLAQIIRQGDAAVTVQTLAAAGRMTVGWELNPANNEYGFHTPQNAAAALNFTGDNLTAKVAYPLNVQTVVQYAVLHRFCGMYASDFSSCLFTVVRAGAPVGAITITSNFRAQVVMNDNAANRATLYISPVNSAANLTVSIITYDRRRPEIGTVTSALTVNLRDELRMTAYDYVVVRRALPEQHNFDGVFEVTRGETQTQEPIAVSEIRRRQLASDLADANELPRPLLASGGAAPYTYENPGNGFTYNNGVLRYASNTFGALHPNAAYTFVTLVARDANNDYVRRVAAVRFRDPPPPTQARAGVTFNINSTLTGTPQFFVSIGTEVDTALGTVGVASGVNFRTDSPGFAFTNNILWFTAARNAGVAEGDHYATVIATDPNNTALTPATVIATLTLAPAPGFGNLRFTLLSDISDDTRFTFYVAENLSVVNAPQPLTRNFATVRNFGQNIHAAGVPANGVATWIRQVGGGGAGNFGPNNALHFRWEAGEGQTFIRANNTFNTVRRSDISNETNGLQPRILALRSQDYSGNTASNGPRMTVTIFLFDAVGANVAPAPVNNASPQERIAAVINGKGGAVFDARGVSYTYSIVSAPDSSFNIRGNTLFGVMNRNAPHNVVVEVDDRIGGDEVPASPPATINIEVGVGAFVPFSMPRVVITVTAGSQTRGIIGTISAVGGVPPYEFTPQDAPQVAEVKPIYPSRLRALGIKTNGELHLTGNNFRFGGLHTLHPITVKDNSQPPNTLTTRFVLSVAPGFQVSAFYSPSGDGGRVTISLHYANAAAGRNVSATMLGYAPADLSVSGDVNLNNARGSLVISYGAATLAQITIRATESGIGGRVASRVLRVFTRRALTLADWTWGAGVHQVSIMRDANKPRATATVLSPIELVGIPATVNEFGFSVQTRDPGSEVEFNVITATMNTTTQTTTTLYTSDNFPYNTVTVERVAADISRALQLIAPRARQSYPGLRLHIWQFGAANAAISSRLFTVRTEVGNLPLHVNFTDTYVNLSRTNNSTQREGAFLTRFAWSGGVPGGRVEFKRGRRWHFGVGKIRVPGYEWLDINAANGEIRVGDKTQFPCLQYDNIFAPNPRCVTWFTGNRTIIMRYVDGANNTSEARMTINIQN